MNDATWSFQMLTVDFRNDYFFISGLDTLKARSLALMLSFNVEMHGIFSLLFRISRVRSNLSKGRSFQFHSDFSYRHYPSDLLTANVNESAMFT